MMERVRALYLFDMDAVLLKSGGYRAALTATVNHFAVEMGFDAPDLTDAEIESFEAAGVTSEWDSAPICLAALWLDGRSRPDFPAIVKRVGAETRQGECPAEAAHRIFSSPVKHAKLDELLLNSRNIRRSRVMSVFQQFTLGQAFESTYGLPRIIETEAFLLKYDRPLLTKPIPANSVIYTARPCGPPRDAPPSTGYAPEAELGAALVGVGHLPIVGFGSMQWLEAQIGGLAEHYVKPSSVHALAAIAVAAGAPESESLIAAASKARGETPALFNELRGGRVMVFEDSARSIGGVREAVTMLGAGWECVGIGIASGGPKLAALEKAADRIYASVDEAIEREIQ